MPWGYARLICSMIIWGLMPRSLRMARGFSFSQALICSCHPVVFLGSAHSKSFSNAVPASATTGTSTTTFLEIDAVSTSICTIFAWGANSFRSPVIRSLKRVPMEKRTSHSLTAILAAYLPCIPQFPTYKGWVVGIAPFPIMVVTTGTFSLSANSCSFSPAPLKFTPPPARIRGFFADFKSL